MGDTFGLFSHSLITSVSSSGTDNVRMQNRKQTGLTHNSVGRCKVNDKCKFESHCWQNNAEFKNVLEKGLPAAIDLHCIDLDKWQNWRLFRDANQRYNNFFNFLYHLQKLLRTNYIVLMLNLRKKRIHKTKWLRLTSLFVNFGKMRWNIGTAIAIKRHYCRSLLKF